MQKIVINVEWCGSNYSGGYGNPDLGVCVATGDTWEEFKQEFAEAMDFHLEGMEEHGLSDVLSEEAMPRCFYGHLYGDGSFTASGELEISGDYEKTAQFQMHNIKKDAFYTVHLGLNNMSDYTQWNCKTADGYTALLALSDRTGLIFVENEGRFVSIIIEEVPDEGMVFTGLPKEKQFLEMVCDRFIFSDLANE